MPRTGWTQIIRTFVGMNVTVRLIDETRAELLKAAASALEVQNRMVPIRN
jgi:hypothetical protein